MNNIKKLIALACLIASSCFLISCENDDNDDTDTSSSIRQERYIIVSGKSDDVIEPKPGDVYQFNGEGWRVIATKDTKIYVQRHSCSGMNEAGVHDVKIGYTIFFKYKAEDVDYIGTPNVIRPSLIEAYRPECISASNNIQYVYTVQTNVVTNTTTTTITTTNIIRR